MNGIVNLYKPLGITSHGMVNKVRRILNMKKVGHTGTLDPEAEGVLPICIGKGTKVSGILTDANKRYEAVIKLGITTDTQDAQGKILKSVVPDISAAEFTKVVSEFTGVINQIPPMYSALKVNGKKLYDLARQGIEIERAPRQITIFEININDFNGITAILDIKCSKGTYIRTLCNDIGDKLGCGAIMEKLKRTASGIFEIKDSISLEVFEKSPEKFIVTPDSLFDGYPKFVCTSHQEFRIKNGCTIPADVKVGMIYRVYSETGEFLSLSNSVNPENPCLKLHTAFF